MPAYDFCYLDASGVLTCSFSAHCDNDQRARILAHAMKPPGTQKRARHGWMPGGRRLEVWNGPTLVYVRPSAEDHPARFPLHPLRRTGITT